MLAPFTHSSTTVSAGVLRKDRAKAYNTLHYNCPSLHHNRVPHTILFITTVHPFITTVYPIPYSSLQLSIPSSQPCAQYHAFHYNYPSNHDNRVPNTMLFITTVHPFITTVFPIPCSSLQPCSPYHTLHYNCIPHTSLTRLHNCPAVWSYGRGN